MPDRIIKDFSIEILTLTSNDEILLINEGNGVRVEIHHYNKPKGRGRRLLSKETVPAAMVRIDYA